ncbi:MAG: DUF479 domain-containing protein [Halieaceae bacterium]|nr:DUF479 domain-containing protein [Halieaceae bacterium]
MNFLAHFHLAWPDSGLVAGGLEGDYCKGPLGNNMPIAIKRGVKLHRSIDAYTDSHPLVIELRREFPPALRRYAGILIDLGFDYCLTRRWSHYSTLALEEFNDAVLRLLLDQQDNLSTDCQTMLARLIEHNILGAYHDWQTVSIAAARIGERFQRGNPLRDVDREMASLKCRLEYTFSNFYPQLLGFSNEQKRHLELVHDR